MHAPKALCGLTGDVRGMEDRFRFDAVSCIGVRSNELILSMAVVDDGGGILILEDIGLKRMWM